MPRFTPEEAFEQGKRDVEMAIEAVAWFIQQFGKMQKDQVERVRSVVLELRYKAHVDAGELK